MLNVFDGGESSPFSIVGTSNLRGHGLYIFNNKETIWYLQCSDMMGDVPKIF